MSAFQYEKDSDGIVTVTMNMSGPVNSMNTEYRAAMAETLEKLEEEQNLTGVVLASAKKVFFAGGDLGELLAIPVGEEQSTYELSELIKSQLRRLELLPVPVVAVINGAALGGGFEICLACNYRIAAKQKSVQIGLPEVTLGLLPGGGGIVRMVNQLGLEKALPFLLEGTKVGPEKALQAGLVDEVVEEIADLVPRAKEYILANRDNEAVRMKPWDIKGFKIPGGRAGSPQLAQLIVMAPAMLRQKTRGLLPAPEKILDCAIEAARLDFDTAQRIESRHFAYLVRTAEAKNLITAFFFQMNKVTGGASRPADYEKWTANRVGVIGAGMMGRGIAYVSALAGMDVVLKDVSIEAAEEGKSYVDKLLVKRISKGRIDEADKEAVLARITATVEHSDLAGCDLIIEAVFEDMGLKNRVVTTNEKHLAEGGIWGSNTSTLPISLLAEVSDKPDNFIGIHFFSPVEKMPLVEIICGDKTSDATLAKAFDYCRQIRKTPIVVNDSLGFFTSRTFGTYLDEGIRLLDEGIHPAEIENRAKTVGMPVGPLAVNDEVSLTLTQKVQETWEALGVQDKWGEQQTLRSVLNKLINEHGRGGRGQGGGFYDYAQDGSKSLWPGLKNLYYSADSKISAADIRDRLLFRQAIETLKCLEQGVLRTVADGNIGSILGIGAPTWTGGFIQFVNTYGVQRFVERCRELAACYGERFEPPQIAVSKAQAGELFV